MNNTHIAGYIKYSKEKHALVANGKALLGNLINLSFTTANPKS